MSRIGNQPVLVPANVKVAMQGKNLKAEGPKGKLSLDLPPFTTAKLDAGKIIVSRDTEERMARSMHG